MNQGKKILFVDDDPNIVQLYTAVFSHAGFNVSIAKNGLEALEKAEIEKPALILLDIMLPDLNGLDVLKKLKQNPETADITVWMVTNLAEQINSESAFSLGATDYLVKSSYTPRQVCEKIQSFMNSRESQSRPSTS